MIQPNPPAYPQGPPPPPGVYTTNQQQPPAYGQPGAASYGQPFGQTSNVVVISQPGAGVPRPVGNCAYCGIGVVRTQYTLLGLLLLVLFFPLGIVCCLMMTERRCSHCRAKF